MTGRDRSDLTRRMLLDASAELFAERGIDAVNLRDIGRAADQRNNSVVHYHFGDKEGLLRALVVEVGNDLDELYGIDGDDSSPDPLVDPLRRCAGSPRGRRLIALLTALIASPSSRDGLLHSEGLDRLVQRLHRRAGAVGTVEDTRRAWFAGLFDVMAGELLSRL